MVVAGTGEAETHRWNSDDISVEQLFDCKEVPTWGEQLTFRAFFVSFIVGIFLCFIVMKLNLTTGIIPSLNVSAGLLGFFLVKTWTKVLDKFGFLKKPFTRQENTVIQTCVVACSGIAFSGGFGSYILGMSKQVSAEFIEANDDLNTKDPHLGWMILFLFTVSFVGLFSVVPLRKIMILGHKLTYPSGTATAHLINSFHTPQGAKLASKQVSVLFKSLASSFIWSFFQWFYSGGSDCGFNSFPTFGLQAYKNRFYFDFSATYVGVGMLCPYLINISLLLGSIISWGILWPYISTKKGQWYDSNLEESSLLGLNGYKVFISIAMILGDGLFQFIFLLFRCSNDIYTKLHNPPKQQIHPFSDQPLYESTAMTFDDRRRTNVFLKDEIPSSILSGGYILLAISSIFTVPNIFPQLKPHHILAAYLIAPLLAFCNAYGCGLTDWSLASSYGKMAIFIFGLSVGKDYGGVLAGLAACGIMMSIVSTASDLMQDFKTGYLTLASPRSMFISQAIGTAMGCVIAPTVFWLFYKAFPLGLENSEYPAPYAKVYRGIALLGVNGISSLPKNCLSFCFGFFLFAMVINGVREMARYKKWWFCGYVPSAMGMAVPFYLGSYFTIDMCVGSVVLLVWERKDKRHAEAFAPAVAAGMICGDGMWSLPASLLAIARINPPMCMRFLSRSDNFKLEALITRQGLPN
ncbi:probable metal-nicotianamine transporter YSL8 [Dendrobium catenatum]|uniref:Putative metal-nicotianamine transporter YSL8 n=1 Tax=Dendrobium catenatum TaxID=906689 RepID=A0A2I0X278_9ASPA|nr:probable metal-nicotianamine transporter YSL8 [Dendrobium catenatum]PKU82024.1 putative metal-nicotianamine transporter YSL8 [Dendrobium catenatum]